MKRKLFLAVIMVLIVCLTCGLLLVACDDKKDNNNDDNTGSNEPISVNASEAWTDMVTRANKGEEYALGLEIRDKETKNLIFGFATEKMGGKDILYGSVNSETYAKFNGFDMSELMEALGYILTGAAGFNINEIWDLVAVVMQENALVHNSSAYQFNVGNISSILSLVKKFESNVMGALKGILGAETTDETINGYIAKIAGVIGLEGVTNFSTLVDAVAVTDDANDPFGGAMKGITSEVRNGAAKNLLNFSLDGSATSTKRNYEIKMQSDIDIFALLDLVYSVKYKEVVSVDENGDPIQAVDDQKNPVVDKDGNPVYETENQFYVDMDKEDILAMLSKLGFLHLEINEVGDSGNYASNIITLHSDFSEGNAVIALNAYNVDIDLLGIVADAPVAVGGVYDFADLIDLINALTSSSEGASAQLDLSSIDIMGILKEVIGYIDFSNIANGVNVEIKNIFSSVLTPILEGALAGTDYSWAAGTAAGMVAGDLVGDVTALNIKVGGQFGNVTEANYMELRPYEMQGGYTENAGDYIASVKSVDGIKFFYDATSGKLFTDKAADKYGAYKLTGVTTDGEEKEFLAYIMGAVPAGEAKNGVQTVTVYIAQANEMIQGLQGLAVLADLGLPELLPLMGVMSVEADATLFTPTETSEVKLLDMVATSGETAKGALGVSVDGKIYYETFINTKGTYTAQDAGTAVEKHKFKDAGVYTVSYTTAFGAAEGTLTINAAPAYKVTYTADEKADGIYDLSQVKVTLDGADTKISYKDLSYDGMPLSAVFENVEGDTYRLYGDKDLKHSNISVAYEYYSEFGARKMSVSTSIKFEKAADITVKDNYVYFTNTANDTITVTIDGTAYKLAYDGEKWVAKAEDGSIADIAVTFEWAKAGSGNFVEFDAAGRITNYPNEYKSGTRYTYVYYTVTDKDGYYITDYFTAYELGASNKTSFSALKVGATLPDFSYLSNVLGADGEKAGYAFKYGSEGYGIYDAAGKLITKVTLKVFAIDGETETDVTATAFDENGGFVNAGSYKVEYELTFNGIAQKFFNNIDVKAN